MLTGLHPFVEEEAVEGIESDDDSEDAFKRKGTKDIEDCLSEKGDRLEV